MSDAFALGWINPNMVLAPRFGLVSAAEIKPAEIYNALAGGKSAFTEAPKGDARKPDVSANITRSEWTTIKDQLFAMITDWCNKKKSSKYVAHH